MANLNIVSVLEHTPQFSVILDQLIAPEVPMVPIIPPVQHAFAFSAAPGPTAVVVLEEDLTAGNTLIVCVSRLNGSDLLASYLSDTLGQTYVRDFITTFGGTDRIAFFRVSNISAGPCTVTFTFPGNSFIAMHVMEFSGMKLTSPVSGTGEGTSASSSTPVTSSFTPGGACRIIGYMIYGSAGDTTITPGNTFTQIAEQETEAGGEPRFNTEYKVGGPVPYTVNWTLGTDKGWLCAAVAYLDS